MSTYYLKRAYEIFREDGAVSLANSAKNLIIHNILPKRRRFWANTIKNKYINSLTYDAPARVDKVIYLDPSRIEKRARDELYIGRGLGQVKGGDWNNNNEPVNETPIFQGIYQRFQKGKDWKDTIIYKDAIKKFEDKRTLRGAGNIEDFLNERCKYVDELYEDIKKNGYKKTSKSGSNTKKFRNDFTDELEILVSIGPNGNIYLYDGQHRFAIAHILDLKIPVQVLCRHKNWQRLRDEIHNNHLPEDCKDLRDHPDLKGILN